LLSVGRRDQKEKGVSRGASALGRLSKTGGVIDQFYLTII